MPNESSNDGPPTGPDQPEWLREPPAGEEPPANIWLEQLIAEQRRRWLQGERDICRGYLARDDHPITSDRLAAAELIYHEFLLREESGESPQLDEHIGRFPEYASELLMIREADHAFDQSEQLPPREGRLGRVGDYVLLELIARGGMGVVFKAHQVSLNRIVALKMLPDGWLATPDQLERFRIEALAAAGLSHPNIVSVHEAGDHAGQPYLVMEYVEGKSLAARTGEHPPRAVEAAGILLKVANAVHYAHEHGTLHRDLKPSNIIIDHRGEPRVTDFGMARMLGGDNHPTITGQVLGTPSYMPPEQTGVKKRDAGPASDVYGLGATLYDLLTGHPPFQAATPLEILKLVVETEPVSPRLLVPDLPHDLETICLKCLQKDPLARYASAHDLADDLKRFLSGSPVLARPEQWWQRGLKLLKQRWKEAALGIACLGVILIVIWLRFVELKYSVERAEHELALAQERARNERAAADTLAARKLAEWQEYRSLESGVRERRTSRPLGWTWSCLDDLARAARFAPDVRNLVDLRGQAAACLAGVDLRKVKAFEMPADTQVDYLAYSPDGRRLAMAQLRGVVERQVRLVDLSSGGYQDLMFPGPKQRDARDTGGGAAAFSRDGRWLVIGTRQGDIYAWDTALPHAKRFDVRGAHEQMVQGLAFHPDGKTLVSSSRDKTLRCWNIPSGWKNVATIPLDRGYTTLAFSPKGALLACGSGHAVHVFPADGLLTAAGPHLSAPREFSGRALVARFSPDGRFLAATNDRHLNLLDPQSLELTCVPQDPDLAKAAHEAEVTNLEFSPDGSFILSSSWDRTVKLWETAAGRLLVKTNEVSADREIVFATFSPRGDQIAVTNGTKAAIYEVGGLEEQTIMAQHSDPVHALEFAPDGKTLACVTDRGLPNQQRRGELTLWDVQSGSLKARQVTTGRSAGVVRSSIGFHPEGAFLAFGQSAREMWLMPLSPGYERSPLAMEEPPNCLVFSPDGRTIWGGVGRRLLSWRMPDLSRASQWSNDLGEYVKGWAGIVSIAVGKQWVVAGCQDDSARVFRVTDGTQPVHTWLSPGGSVGSVALSRDEALAVMGTLSGRIRVVRVPGGEPVADLSGHSDEVTSVALGPEDNLLATASLDRTIRLWKRQGDSFYELLSLGSPSGGVIAIRFSKKGDKLAFLVKNETAVRIWHLDRLEQRLEGMKIGW